MKLKTSLEDRPGFLHVLPLFDLLALFIMLLVMVPLLVNNYGLKVETPTSQFEIDRFQKSYVVTIGPGDSQAAIYLGRNPILLEKLPQELEKLNQNSQESRTLVLLKTDQNTSVAVERKVTEMVLAAGFQLALVGGSPKATSDVENSNSFKK